MLRDEFFLNIMPRLDEFARSCCKAKQLIELIELNPNYVRTSAGLVQKAKAQIYENILKPQIGTDYIVAKLNFHRTHSHNDEDIEMQVEDNDDIQESHTIIVPYSFREQAVGDDFVMVEENSVFLYTTLSRDGELARSVRLSNSELHRRLIVAKDRYEDSGQLPFRCQNLELFESQVNILHTLSNITVELFNMKVNCDKSSKYLNNAAKS